MLIPPDATLTAFGRQALSLVAQELREQRIVSIWAPDYYCPTMLVPFSMEGINVRTLPTGRDCLLKAGALADAVAARPGAAVLHSETYGNLAGRKLTAVLKRAMAAGTRVVVDQTHSWMEPGSFAGDYRVASLRKLLAIPDGAWVRGLRSSVVLGRDRIDELVTEARLDFLANRSVASHEAAEDLIDQAWTPAAPSPAALALLAQHDLSSDLAVRRRNARQLRTLLQGFDIVNPGASCCVALRHPRAGRLMDVLKDHGVVGPVHWQRPENLPRGRTWKRDLLSLPVDSRFGPEELRRMARVIREVDAEQA